MADETPMSPISEAVPPKANPLATPATAHTATLKLNPVVRRPAAAGVGATQTALKPGLKLPPKPGVATGLKLPQKPSVPTGLKLPPKTGATVAGLKPGVRLPTQSGLKPGIKLPTQTALKPGVKLPARPVIRKPGSTVKAPVPSTVVAQKVTPTEPVAEMTPVEMTPVAEMTPVVEAPNPVESPEAVQTAPAAPVAEAPKQEQPKPLEALKAVTQNLKSITSPIPQQAILRKTGIIADAEMTEAQKQAAKSKTARISLSDAMGVAPVKNEVLPMKTIRIKRPVDIPGATNPTATAKPLAPSTEPANPVDTQAETKVAEPSAPSTSFTQRKTLKIARPGGGAVRPSGKFGIKKPSATVAKPATAESAAPAAGEVANIPDLPTVSAAAPGPIASGELVPDVPKGVATVGLIVQIAACVAMAFLGWLLVENAQLPVYCGGLGM